MQNSKYHGALFFVVALILIVMAACSDDDVEDLAEEILPSTRARVIHLSPDTPEVDVDFELIEVQGTIVGLNYKEASPYNEVSTGTTEVTFRNTSGNRIASLDDPDFDHDDYNTVYLVNLSGNLQIIQSQDNRSTSASMAKVRFVNACVDCPSVDLRKDRPSEETMFENDAFREITDYVLATPGNYAFVITEAGNTVDALATFTPVTLAANAIYTIVLFGTIDDTDDYAFGVRVYEDSGNGTEWTEPSIAQ